MVVYEPNAMKPLSDFHDELLFEFPNLPSQLFDYYILRTAITMAREGHLIRRRAVIEPEPCVSDYRLQSPDGLKICGVLNIWKHDCCHDAPVIRSFVPPTNATCCSRDAAWYDDRDSVVHLTDGGCSGRYFIALAVEPDRDACELPVEFMDKFFPTLMMGAKASILLIMGRPWSNLRVGAACRQEFHNMLAADSVDTATHKMRGAVRMSFGRAI